MARRAFQGQAGNYLGRTLPDRGSGAEPGTEGLLPTRVALGRIAVGLGPPASRGRGLGSADYLLRSNEDALARAATASDSVRRSG